MNKCFLFLFALVLTFSCCSSSTDSNLTAEEVARKWQSHIDKNQFDDARKLSTTRAKELVNLIESMIYKGDNGEASLIETQFLEMKCREMDNTAICEYVIQEEEKINDSFKLINEGGRWLIDIPEEATLLENDPVNDLYDDFEKSLNEALEK